jgi:hypothetical protein
MSESLLIFLPPPNNAGKLPLFEILSLRGSQTSGIRAERAALIRPGAGHDVLTINWRFGMLDHSAGLRVRAAANPAASALEFFFTMSR